MERILYVGGFRLPDRNAAAQRVSAIAKGFRELGHTVYFLNYAFENIKPEWKRYYGFECFEKGRRSIWRQLTDVSDALKIIEEKEITAVIAYNYPAVAFQKLLWYCKKRNIKIYADVTEWYVAQGNVLFKIIKTIDTEWRMRALHTKCDGIIAISEYLYKYYKNKVKTVKVPPTIDCLDEKWKMDKEVHTDETTFVYAGSPGAQKERLDLIVNAVEKIGKVKKIKLNVIGITADQYGAIYNCPYHGCHTRFLGRVEHLKAIQYVSEADWTIVVRDNNKVVQAGFPTKVTESISCGTPIVANEFSNISDYLDESNSILCDISNLTDAISKACECSLSVDPQKFDFRYFLDELQVLLN